MVKRFRPEPVLRNDAERLALELAVTLGPGWHGIPLAQGYFCAQMGHCLRVAPHKDGYLCTYTDNARRFTGTGATPHLAVAACNETIVQFAERVNRHFSRVYNREVAHG